MGSVYDSAVRFSGGVTTRKRELHYHASLIILALSQLFLATFYHMGSNSYDTLNLWLSVATHFSFQNRK
jgi:hypothetical protein